MSAIIFNKITNCIISMRSLLHYLCYSYCHLTFLFFLLEIIIDLFLLFYCLQCYLLTIDQNSIIVEFFKFDILFNILLLSLSLVIFVLIIEFIVICYCSAHLFYSKVRSQGNFALLIIYCSHQYFISRKTLSMHLCCNLFCCNVIVDAFSDS